MLLPRARWARPLRGHSLRSRVKARFVIGHLPKKMKEQNKKFIKFFTIIFSFIIISRLPFATYDIYISELNSDSAWTGFALLINSSLYIFILLVNIGPVISTFKYNYYKRLSVLNFFFIIVALIIFQLANRFGKTEWENEFESNKTKINNIVDKILLYKNKTGEYPKKINDFYEGDTIIVYKNQKPIIVEYNYLSDTSFRLTYNYGWYFYNYVSEYNKWEISD